jgi:predicted nuclease of predicted toxin-antitoxin system
MRKGWTAQIQLQSGQPLTIVSKDADFHQRSFVEGQPPKVVWLRVGNCTTEQVAATLRRHVDDLHAFAGDEESAFMIVS